MYKDTDDTILIHNLSKIDKVINNFFLFRSLVNTFVLSTSSPHKTVEEEEEKIST